GPRPSALEEAPRVSRDLRPCSRPWGHHRQAGAIPERITATGFIRLRRIGALASADGGARSARRRTRRRAAADRPASPGSGGVGRRAPRGHPRPEGAAARRCPAGARRPRLAVTPDPPGLPISEAREELAARRLSPVELIEGTLARIDRHNDELNAYLHVDPEGALAAARLAEKALRNGSAGPLAGIPICVKDVIGVAGMPTTAGASGWSRHPAADAPAVARLREAGAIVVGKGNTNEFAFGIDGQNPHWGSCRNPHDETRISGGSSAGPASAT